MDTLQLRRLFSPPPRSHSEETYALLSSNSDSDPERSSPSTSTATPHPPRRILRILRSCFTLRRILILTALIPLIILIILCNGIPPSYADVRDYERRLPQHNLSLPFPEGENGMYLRFPGHIWGHGLNNILQETILMSYLAYASRRSFVFEDYVWSHTPFPYTIYDLSLRPARIPLNAFISGPTAGGPMPAPRAISSTWWDTVCPKRKRFTVSSRDAPNEEEGAKIIEWWVQLLDSMKEGCVEVDSRDKAVFDRFLFGSSRILSIWPSLSTSPILKSFTWSPLVTSALERNFAILRPSHPFHSPALPPPPDSPADSQPPPPPDDESLPGLVAVHIRRGDYKRHCPRLALWGSLYMGFNEHASLPDKFRPDTSLPQSSLTSYYLAHCLPTPAQITKKLHALRESGRKEGRELKRVFVLTNGWGWWLRGLEGMLREDGWEEVNGSSDLVLDGEQRHVDAAVDMAIAVRSEVFLGNGFSSLTSNIVMLRLAKGLDPSTIRFL